MKPKRLTLTLALIYLSASAITALAATPPPAGTPNIGSALQEAESAKPAVPPREEETNIAPVSPIAPEEAKNEASILVNAFKLEGIQYIPEAEIEALLVPYTGRNLTMRQLEEATGKITALYQSRRYSLARAYLPRQKAEGGVITMRVLVGHYGKVSVENKSLVRDSVIERTLRHNLKEDQPTRRADLERAVLLVGDLSGARIPRLSMDAGEKPGTSEFFAEVPPENRFNGYLMTDNMGSRYTGRWRFGGGADVNSPLGLGDKLSIFGLTTEHTGLNNAGLTYAVPILSNGLRASLTLSHVNYELGGEFRAMDATGASNIIEGTLSYPFIRSAAQNLTVNLNVAHKQMKDEYAAFDWEEKKYSNVAKLSARYEAWGSLLGKALYTRLDGGVAFGKLTISSEEARLLDARDTHGSFAYLTLGAKTSLAVTEALSLSLSLSGQKALNRNLDSSEQMAVTNSGGVKAYREVIAGDNAWLTNIEVAYRLPSPLPKLSHSVSTFFDVGGWEYAKKPYPVKHSDTLSDIGLGYTVRYDNFSARAQLAHGLGSYPSELKRESHTYVSAFLMWSF